MGPAGRAQAAGDSQSQEMRAEEGSIFLHSPALPSSGCRSSLASCAGPSPQPPSSYKCCRMPVAVGKMDDGTLAWEQGAALRPLPVL